MGKNPLALGTTGGRGSFALNCRLTPAQLLSWAPHWVLLDGGPTMWRYDRTMVVAKPEYQASLDGIAATLAGATCVVYRRV